MAGLRPETEVRFLPGVGPERGRALNDAGVFQISDLLLRLPFRYEDRSVPTGSATDGLVHGETAALDVLIESVRVRPTRRKGLKLVELRASYRSRPVRAVWFNRVHLRMLLKPGQQVLLIGKVHRPFPGATPEFRNPQWELVVGGRSANGPGRLGRAPLPRPARPEGTVRESAETRGGAHVGRIVPVYERIGPITPRLLRTLIHRALRSPDAVGPGHLPGALTARLGLPPWRQAVEEVHFPPAGAALADYDQRRSPAHRRLIVEEFFLYALALRLFRVQARRRRRGGRSFRVDEALRDLVRRVLPFRLTRSQREVLREIAGDLQSDRTMRRLLQGDVGSGKTIVAVIAALIVMHNGAQTALMAPTSVLAEQHAASVRRLLEPHGIRTALLTARLGVAERRDTVRALATGWARFIVGTHAMIQEGARFHDLGLAIVDEQHRFGVGQRGMLVGRGKDCDLLVMTATPIPRTLTMAAYGDLDLSEIRELPPGRQPVRTEVHRFDGLERVYRLVRDEARKRRQTFYVCPTIEDSEEFPGVGVETRFRELAEGPFRELRTGFVHGRLPAARREEVMGAFADGELDVLVATTVIEVGVDVPNATVMVVEHAERFGLAQLHQLRGRIGRGGDPAAAILLVGDDPSTNAVRRLRVLEETHDGFRIAEEDLAIRGPGELLGTKQSGVPLFRVGDLIRDAELFRLARKEAGRFLASAAPRSREGGRILEHVRSVWGERFGLSGAAG